MSLRVTVTKDCFPPSTECHNCTRKRREVVTGRLDQKHIKPDLKRCAGCHLFTYCDRDCQREHWKSVHKKYCKVLSGKEVVPNTKHVEDSCPECIKNKNTTAAEFASGNSPKSKCHIETMIVDLKESLRDLFDFHGEGKTCNCSLTFACDLPFPMGEVSGQFVDDSGLELMIAHALKLLHAMGVKIRKPGVMERLAQAGLLQVWYTLISARLELWWDLLLRGRVEGTNNGANLFNDVDSLKDFYGTTNPWWKALKFSVTFIGQSEDEIILNSIDSSIAGDPRFKNLKLKWDYSQSQRQKKAIVSATNRWENFKLWPTLQNKSLTLVLPNRTSCQGCFKPLRGPFSLTSDDFLPTLMPFVGENGKMMAFCSTVISPRCLVECSKRNELLGMVLEGKVELYNEENKKFCGISRGCDFCLKLSLASHRCSACLAAQYCSTRCQHEDLEFHKTVCSRWAKDKSRKIAPGKEQMKIYKSQQKEIDGK